MPDFVHSDQLGQQITIFRKLNNTISAIYTLFKIRADKSGNTTDGFVIFPLGAKSFSELHTNERMWVLPWEVGKLHSLDWKNHKEKLVIQQPVTFQNKTYFNLHRLLRAINRNCLLSQLPIEARASEKETFVSPSALLKAFEQFQFIVTNTYQLMDTCNVSIDFTVDKNKQCYSARKKDDKVLLLKLAHDGLLKRFGKKNKVALERMEEELKIIDELGFNAYFLINNEIVQHATSRGFYHVGRGSGANSKFLSSYFCGRNNLGKARKIK